MIHQRIIYASPAPDNADVHYRLPPPDPREVIEKLRVERGFKSLRALAIAAGVTQPTLQRYMSGETKHMDVGNMLAIAQTLGVTISELLGEVPPGSSVAAREIQRALAEMDEVGRAQVAAVVKAMSGRT